MLWYLVRRLGEGVGLIFAVTAVTFALLSVNSTTVARTIAGRLATDEQVAQKVIELGLDQPVVERYLDWLASAATGDLGASWYTMESVTTLMGNKLPVTFSLVVAAMSLSAITSIALGVAAAIRRGWVDQCLQVISLIGYAFPSFVLGLLLALAFAIYVPLFPAVGFVPFDESPGLWLASITLPTIALTIQVLCVTSQQVRGSMIDVMQSDFVRTLRSRGIGRGSLYFRHALRSAAPPALTVLGMQSISLIGGTVVVEKVFGMMGLGTAIVGSAAQGDTPVVMGIVTVMVLIIVVINLLLDVGYAWLNPKVRMQ
jgi:peptide/nickel transport system permease protein